MTTKEVFELLDRFEGSTLTGLRIVDGSFSVELSRGTAAAEQTGLSQMPAAVTETRSSESGETITAPIVGTFYAAPAPDQPPFVTEGARVSKGQTVCLIEAMKMMSEVHAPCDCIIEKVLCGNGEMAEFGQPLFSIRSC